jgi:hypothetical protein
MLKTPLTLPDSDDDLEADEADDDDDFLAPLLPFLFYLTKTANASARITPSDRARGY